MKTKNILLFFLIFTFLFLRLYHLPERVNFSMEQGKILLNIYRLWQEKKPTLIGLETSIKTLNGRAFYQGPWIYYFPLPILLITNWHPLSPSYLLIGLNLLALLILFKSINKKFNLAVAFLTGLLFTFSPKMISFSHFIWNPNFLPLTSSILIYFWLKNFDRPKIKDFFYIGLTLGIGLGCHYQTVILIFLTFILMIYRKLKLKTFLACSIGLLIGFSPLIIFELKHNFYNLKTIITIINQGTSKKLKFPPPFYYFISLMPLVYLLTALIINKMFGKKIQQMLKNKLKIKILMTLIFAIYFLTYFYQKPLTAFGMPLNWSYLKAKKTADIIAGENKKKYNIASLLSGDTRAYALRFLVTINNHPPLPIDHYPQADYLFGISPHNQQETINNSVWEISSFCPCSVKKSWQIEKKISLFLLQKKERN